MTAFMDCLVIVTLGWLALRGWRRKAFSEDDGNWFFLAAFQGRGARLWHGGLHTVGYFGIEWLAAQAARIAGRRDAAFFYACKAWWLTATACAAYLAADALWGRAAGLGAGLAFLAACAAPSTLFSLTYGEHVFLLPLALCLTLLGHAGDVGALAFFGAGLMAGWMVHIKLTALAWAVVVPLAFPFLPGPWTALWTYAVGFAVIMLAPLALIPLVEKCSPRQYLINLVTPLAEYAGYVLERLGVIGARELWNRAFNSWEYGIAEAGDSYLGVNSATSRGRRGLLAWRNLRWSLRDLWGVLCVAGAWLVCWPLRGDGATAALIGVGAVLVGMQQVQQNYFTPHFNPLWLPVALLAGAGAHWAVQTGGMAWWALVGVGLAQAGWLALRLRRFAVEEREGRNPDGTTSMWGLFALAREVGTAVRELAREGERLLVWGDHPALYLYADRFYIGRATFFLYGHGARLRYADWLVSEMRRDPPELLLFFTYRVRDEWDAAAVSRRTGAAYLPERLFRVPAADPQAPPYDFGLYRLDAAQWRQALVEEARRTCQREDRDAARVRLERVLARYPGDAEASLRLAMLDVERAARAAWLETRRAGAHAPDERAAVLFAMAQESARGGDQRAAARMLDEALALAPDDAGMLTARGEAAYARGRAAEAVAFLRRALDINPYSADALTDMAVILAGQGRRDEAATLLRRALDAVPDHRDARQSLAALGIARHEAAEGAS